MAFSLLNQSKPKMNIEPLAPSMLNDDEISLEGQVVVVKFGGNAVLNESVTDSLIDDTLNPDQTRRQSDSRSWRWHRG